MCASYLLRDLHRRIAAAQWQWLTLPLPSLYLLQSADEGVFAIFEGLLGDNSPERPIGL
jgi:hypothetical protein